MSWGNKRNYSNKQNNGNKRNDSNQFKKIMNDGTNATGISEQQDKFRGEQIQTQPQNTNTNESNINQNIIENPLYLFVVIHKFDKTNNSITSNIINVFETQADDENGFKF